MSTQQINQTIVNSNPGDKINWTPGTYQHGLRQNYVFIGDRDYTFEDGTIIRGRDPESWSIFRTTGSNINITSNGTVIMENSEIIGVFTGDTFYDNINVSGITSITGGTREAQHYIWCNIKDTKNVTEPSINFSNMTLHGASTGFHFNNKGKRPTSETPYVNLTDITARGLRTILIDLFGTDDTGELVIVGNEDIENVALVDSGAVVTEGLWEYFSSPHNVIQENVTTPYINEATNCFEAEPGDFYEDTLNPTILGNANLGYGQFIGSQPPVAELSDMQELAYSWLAEEGDPHFDPKLDLAGMEETTPTGAKKQVGDGKIDLKDFAAFAKAYQRSR